MRTKYKLLDTDNIEKDKALIDELHRVADKYGATFESHYSLDYPFIIKQIFGQNLEIADFGCGIGALSFYLAEKGHKVWAFDRHDFSWFFTHPNIRFVQSNLLDHNSSGLRMGGRIVKKYDVVVAASAVEHNPNKQDIRTLVLEGLKVLKPGGKMILTTECWKETKWAPLQESMCLGPKDIERTFDHPIDFTEFDVMYGKFTNYPEWRHKCWEFLPYGVVINNES